MKTQFNQLVPLAMLTFALAVGAALAAQAMDWQGMDSHGYYSIKGGVNQFSSQNVDTYFSPIDFSSKAGYDVSGQLGLYLNPNLRAELEFAYANADMNRAKLAGYTLDRTSGELQTFAGMGNVYYDLFSDCRISPFVGGGIGLADVRFHRYQAGNIPLVDDDGTAFAYQLMAGMKYHMTPHLSATLEYRYFGTAGVNVHSSTDDSSSVKVRSQNALAGLEFLF